MQNDKQFSSYLGTCKNEKLDKLLKNFGVDTDNVNRSQKSLLYELSKGKFQLK